MRVPKRIPKNLKSGDRLILLEVHKDKNGWSVEYSRLTIVQREPHEGEVTYRIRGNAKIWENGHDPAMNPCNGVVYSDSQYEQVTVIRKKKELD